MTACRFRPLTLLLPNPAPFAAVSGLCALNIPAIRLLLTKGFLLTRSFESRRLAAQPCLGAVVRA